ncbi:MULTISPECIES: hypothetical protein [unclassified Rhizobium]|uniref:hypothetical protein n=1 Tax=unclassified Rhizobium TaxID=2613769 RepID=UPI001FFE10D5|nr:MULTISPECIES: hypothetical protein [unclassified Rhizobium]
MSDIEVTTSPATIEVVTHPFLFLQSKRMHQIRPAAAKRSAPGHASYPQKERTVTARQKASFSRRRARCFHSRIQQPATTEALDMKALADIYKVSTRAYSGLLDIKYPFHDRDILVTNCGRICMHRKKINISTVEGSRHLARQLHAT